MSDNKRLELITSLMIAISNCSMYAADHAMVRTLAGKSVGIIDGLMGEDDTLDLMIVDDALVINNEPLHDKSTHLRTFIRRTRRKGVDKIIFKKGISPEEVRGLISAIADPAAEVKNSEHVSTGAIEVRLGTDSMEGFSVDELELLKNKQLDTTKEVFSAASRFKKLDVTGLEDIVINFIAIFKKEANILNILSPFKSYSEFTYTHATNVAILSMFQAESLGLAGTQLHDIGISALLHDVGKMFISNDILEKKGKLDNDEWEEIKKHTLYGAKYLMKLESLPKIAVPVAYAHHMRYDGSGYPETKIIQRKQHLFSQIVAIADVFDALRAKRPYKQDAAVVEILALLQDGRGSEFNPLLVDNLASNLGKFISITT